MGFNQDLRRARDKTLAPARRFNAFLSCLERFAFLRHRSFQKLLSFLGHEFGVHPCRRIDDESFGRALEWLERERAEFNERLRLLAAQRRFEKTVFGLRDLHPAQLRQLDRGLENLRRSTEDGDRA